MIPGPKEDDNHFQVTATVQGDYRGKCYELCGVYHSRMLFNVRIVSDSEFQGLLRTLPWVCSSAGTLRTRVADDPDVEEHARVVYATQP